MENLKKFVRSTNFTSREENVLLSLVKKHKDAIECKRTDTNTNTIKSKAWIELTKEYNAACPEYERDVKVLRNKYENIKKQTKQKFADHKQYLTGTGGGPEKDIVITTIDNDIHEILGTQLTGLSSEFDDDVVSETIHIATNDSIDGVPELNDVCRVVNSQTDPSPTNQKHQEEKENWAKYTPTMLRTPKATSLRVLQRKENNQVKRPSAKSGIAYKLEEWGAKKIALSEVQKDCFLEEHNLKIKHMKELHEQKMQIEEKEAETRMLYLKREHESKMELLEIEKVLIKKKL